MPPGDRGHRGGRFLGTRWHRQGGQYPHGAQRPVQAPSPCQGLPLTPLLGGRPGFLGSHRLSPDRAVCMVPALQNPCESSGTGGAQVHAGSGALTLSWENSSLTSSLPCFADGGAEVSGGPSSRPSCLCGAGCRAEPGSRSAHSPPALRSPGAHTVLAVSSGFPCEGEGVRVSGSFCNSRPEDMLPWLSQPRDLPVGSTNTEPSGRALSASGLQDRPQPITLPLPRPSWVGCGVSESGACGFRMRPGTWWVG